MFLSIKMDLALDNVQQLICHKTKQNKTKQNSWMILLRSIFSGAFFGRMKVCWNQLNKDGVSS